LFCPFAASAQDAELDAISRAVQAIPRQTIVVARSGNFGIYDLQIEKLCGGGGLSDAIINWVDAASYSETWGGRIRIAALNIVLNFRGAKPTVKLPLVVVANTGARGIKQCDTLLLSDVPRGQPVQVSFEFSTAEKWRFGDAKPILDALTNAVTAAAGLQAWGGAAVFGPAIQTTLSFLKADAGPVVALTQSANALLSLMDRQRAPRPTQVALNAASTRVSYTASRREVFALKKDWLPSRLRVPAGGYGYGIALAYGTAFPQKNLYTTFGTVAARFPNWTKEPEPFCTALRDTLMAETEGDRIAMNIALAEHASYQSFAYPEFPDSFKARRRTCLYKAESDALAKMGWEEPFAGAFVPAAPVSTPVARLSSPARTAARARPLRQLVSNDWPTAGQ
jgi:hypothetical protein